MRAPDAASSSSAGPAIHRRSRPRTPRRDGLAPAGRSRQPGEPCRTGATRVRTDRPKPGTARPRITAWVVATLAVLGTLLGAAPAAHAASVEVGRISGVIRDAAGQPLQGISVSVHHAGGRVAGSISNAAGEYVAMGRPGKVRVVATDPARVYASETWPDTPVTALGTELDLAEGGLIPNVDFQLAPGGGWSGIVRDQAGNPLPKAMVGIKYMGHWMGDSTAGPGGEYSWGPMAPGAWTIYASGPVGSPLGLSQIDVTITGQEEGTHDFVLGPKFVNTREGPPAQLIAPTAPQSSTTTAATITATPAAPTLAPARGRVAVHSAGSFTREVQCADRSRCVASITVTTVKKVKAGRRSRKARVQVATGFVDTTVPSSEVLIELTSAGRAVLKRAGRRGLAVKLVTDPEVSGARSTATTLTLVAR